MQSRKKTGREMHPGAEQQHAGRIEHRGDHKRFSPEAKENNYFGIKRKKHGKSFVNTK